MTAIRPLILVLFVALFSSQSAFAQESSPDKDGEQDSDEFQVVFDNPYEMNRLWLHAIPVYFDGFIGNLNVGYGLKAEYLATDKLMLEVSARKSYGEDFEIYRSRGEKNNDFDNDLRAFYFVEGIASYELKDSERLGRAKVVQTSKDIEAWEMANTRTVVVPAMVREIYAVRGGGYAFRTVIDVKETLAAQGEDIAFFEGQAGANDLSAYSTITSQGFILGGSYTQIKNVAIRGPEQRKESSTSVLVTESIVTLYADVLYSPSQEIGKLSGTGSSRETANLRFNELGWRLGFQLKSNRDFALSFGAEVGAHTALDTRSGYALLKLGFPVFSYKMEKDFKKK